MANDRLSLHNELKAILKSENVYFQPPSTVTLKYPCIIYKLDDAGGTKADNKRYLNTKTYFITLVDKNPDTTILDRMLDLQYLKFNKHFVFDNLNHYTFVHTIQCV